MLTRLLPLAILTGVATAGAVAVFKLALHGVEWLAFGWGTGSWLDAPPLVILLAPTVGGLLVGLALHVFRAPEDPGHGVTEVIQAATLDREEFPYRSVPLKASLAVVSLGSGAALGPEDPAVEIGGGIGEAVARRAKLPHAGVRAMVAAGAASGISTILYTPFAGILFAIEVTAVRIRSRAAMLVAASAFAAFGTMLLLLPGIPVVLDPDPAGFSLPLVSGLILCIGLGVLAGFVALVQIRLSYALRHAFLEWKSPPRWLKPALGGLLLGCVGLLLPHLLGIGYGTIQSLVEDEPYALALLAALLIGKMLAMALSFGSGMLGGFFAPALFIGAVLGSLFGEVGVTVLGPDFDPGTFAMIGMAAALAGMVHAPLTAAAALGTLSGQLGLLPFLLAASLTSHWLARWLSRGSLYTYPLTDGEEPGGEPPKAGADFGDQPDLV